VPKNPRAATEVISVRWVHLRATPAEKQDIVALAKREGVTLSEWLRDAIEERVLRSKDRSRILEARY